MTASEVCPCGHPYPCDEHIDPLIEPYVRTLQDAGIETVESCQATHGHMGGLHNPLPWIRFVGGAGAGYKAVGIALELGWPVVELAREWDVLDCALEQPVWRLKFRRFSAVAVGDAA